MATQYGKRSAARWAALAAAAAVLGAGGAAPAHAKRGVGVRALASAPNRSFGAAMQYAARRQEAGDDLFTANAICLNEAECADRVECFAEARADKGEADKLCGAQYKARREVCGLLGEERHDPEFEPEEFDEDFSALTNPNPYFPLAIGAHWTYEGEGETIEIEVLDKTKRIEGVACVVVRDRVEEDGVVVEDTDDWFGQRKDGGVDYCGEISLNYELFEGDDPEEPELTDVEGSWKHGRDGALAGTQFPAEPEAGETYRQEWAPGNAEDMATVLSTTYAYGADPELDEFVPQELAELLCSEEDRVVTKEFTPIAPGVFERKYYAPGIGFFLEVNPAAGEIAQLTECNADPKCAMLPAP